MKADYRKVLLKIHGYLLQEEQDAKPSTVPSNQVAQAHRLKLEQLIQQALTEAFLEESATLNNPTILKDLLEK